MKPLSKPFFFPLLLTAVMLLLLSARPAAAAKHDAPWAGSGTGTTKVASDGTAADPQFDYSALGFSSGAWSYSATAASARSVPIKWEYSGFHAWFMVRVSLERFVQRGGVDVLKESLVDAGPASCCAGPPSGGFAYSGTSTFNLQKGDVYGFRFAGSHGDSNRTLQGSLVLREVDATPPSVTASVTGKQGANGYYTGPATVKWTTGDDDSRISARTGCDDATVSEDTKGKTITCTAKSAGGTTTKSVTIKRDTVAPELTVPPVVVQQGATAVSYAASATDAIDAAPKVECDRPSGSEFPIGTTSVTCTATDAAGHRTSKAFDAIVIAPTPQVQPTTRPAPRQINAVLAFRFTISKKTTRLIQLKVKNIPAGSTVTITCKGNSCPKTLKGSGTSRLAKGSSVSLATLVKAGLRSGTTINVKVSSPGALTATKTLVVRRGKAPVVR